MSALRRKAVESVGRLPTAVRTTRRYSSAPHDPAHPPAAEHAHDHDHDHDHGHGHHSEPVNESLGPQFFVALAAIPISIGVYVAAQPGKDGKAPAFSRLIDSYSNYKEQYAAQYAARNTLHTTMIEQAAFDRNLYQSNYGSTHIDLRFPEIFNTGSPHNVSAGQQARGLDELVAHYEKVNHEAEEKKIQALADKKK